jgi:hypothetical protein
MFADFAAGDGFSTRKPAELISKRALVKCSPLEFGSNLNSDIGIYPLLGLPLDLARSKGTQGKEL